MEKLEGVELSRAKLEPAQVLPVLDLVLDEVAGAYEGGYVHADMSEYNVSVGERGVTVFDWPQAVPTTHENADEFLERDVSNLLSYFRRKHPSRVPETLEPEPVAGAIREGEFESVEEFR